jgi:hypothetical protein
MASFQATVDSQALEKDGRISIRLSDLPLESVNAGQAFSACLPGHDWHCHTILPLRAFPHGFAALLPEPARWPPGSQLLLRGPFGAGLQPPKASRRWLLLGFGGLDPYLRPLIDLGLSNNISVAYASHRKLEDLPPAVEVLRTAMDAVEWADYVAGVVSTDQLEMLSRLMQDRAWQLRSSGEDQVLMVRSLPCGMGGCQACAFEDRGHRRLLCVDGLVFPLGRLQE